MVIPVGCCPAHRVAIRARVRTRRSSRTQSCQHTSRTLPILQGTDAVTCHALTEPGVGHAAAVACHRRRCSIDHRCRSRVAQCRQLVVARQVTAIIRQGKCCQVVRAIGRYVLALVGRTRKAQRLAVHTTYRHAGIARIRQPVVRLRRRSKCYRRFANAQGAIHEAQLVVPVGRCPTNRIGIAACVRTRGTRDTQSGQHTGTLPILQGAYTITRYRLRTAIVCQAAAVARHRCCCRVDRQIPANNIVTLLCGITGITTCSSA